MTNGIFGIARHVEHAHLGALGGDATGQFAATHSGHDHIRQQETDSALVAGRDLQGGGAVVGFEDLVALRLQVLAGELAEIDFVFDQENGFLPALGARQAESVLHGGGLVTGVDAGKIDS